MSKKHAQKKILIVEDNKKLNNILIEKIVREGFVVYTAFDGEEGLQLAYERQPDLILLDILMPVLDGFEFMEQLRNNAWGKKEKVIILTNASIKDERVAKMVIQKDPIAFLSKSSTKLKDLVRYIRYAFDDE